MIRYQWIAQGGFSVTMDKQCYEINIKNAALL